MNNDPSLQPSAEVFCPNANKGEASATWTWRLAKSPAFKYATAAGLVILAIFPYLLLNRVLTVHAVFVPFYIAVLTSTMMGGWKPGCLAAILSLPGASFVSLTLHPDWSLFEPSFLVRSGLFLVLIGLTVWVVESQRAARTRAETIVEELVREISRHEQTESKLTASEERYRSLFENSLDAVFTLNVEGFFMTANPSALSLCGYSLADLQTMKFTALCPPEQHEEAARHFILCAQGNPEPFFEVHIINKEGRRMDLFITGGPIKLRGRIVGVFGIAADITERKRAQMHVAAFSRLGQELGSVTTPVAAGRIIGDVAEELFGWDSFSLNLYSLETNETDYVLNVDTFDGQKTEILPFVSSPGIPALAHRIMSGGPELVLNAAGVACELVAPCGSMGLFNSIMYVPIRAKEGMIGILAVRSRQPDDYDENDLKTLLALADYCSGALQRIRAEEALHGNEQEYRALFDSDGSGKCEVNPQTRKFLRANPKFCEWTGYTMDELREKTFLDITDPDDQEISLKNFQRVMAGEIDEFRFEKRYRRRDGSVWWADVTVTLMRDVKGQPVRMIGTTIDITARVLAETALRESEARFTSFMEHLSATAWMKDTKGRYLYVNAAAAEVFDKKANDILGRTDAELFRPEEAARFMRTDERVLECGNPVQSIETHRRPDGQHYTVVNKFPILDKDGRISIVAGIGMDITARIQAETALRESETRFASFMEHLSAPAWMKDLQGRYVYVNAACARNMDLSPGAIIGKTDTELIPGDTAKMLEENDQKALNSPIAVQSLETWSNPQGDRYFMVSKFPIRDKQGEVTLIAGVGMEITERRAAEEALSLSNQRLGLIAQVTNAVLGDEPLKQQMNTVAETVRAAYGVKACIIRLIEGDRMTLLAAAGVKPAELTPSISMDCMIGREILTSRGPLFIPNLQEIPPDPSDANDPRPTKPEFISYVGAPLLAQDRIIGILGIFTEQRLRDFTQKDLDHLQIIANHIAVAITNDRLYQEVSLQKGALEEQIRERMEAEEEVQKLNLELESRVTERTRQLQIINAELEAFAYSVSHDLRGPLRSVGGFSEALKDEYEQQLDDQGREYLDRVMQACREMDKLIDDMLHLSRLTRMDMKRQPVNLSLLAEGIIRQLRETEPRRHVAFSIEPGLVVAADPRLMRIALENLLNNAWKFTGRAREPQIEFGMAEEAGGLAYFVRDNGAGFDMEFAGKLFGAFQRLHSTHEFPGHGIGLATVQRIINRHGGRTWARGEVDRGASFYFTLPT